MTSPPLHPPQRQPDHQQPARRWWLFYLEVAVLTMALTFGWQFVAGKLAGPSTSLARTAIEALFGDSWLYRTVLLNDQALLLETRVRVPYLRLPDGRMLALPPGAPQPELKVQIDPSRAGYGLPIFLAILIAARSRKPLLRAAIGAVALVPVQAFCTVVWALREVVFSPLVAEQLDYPIWLLNAFVPLIQFGILMFPALAPVVIWFVLDAEMRQQLFRTGATMLNRATCTTPPADTPVASSGTTASPPS